jgi:hypothetical protein
MANKLKILVESRIRWKVYVRFGGEYMETYYSDIARRWVLSLHYVQTQPFLLQLFGLMDLMLRTTDPVNPVIWLRGIPLSGIVDTIRAHVLETRQHNRIYEIN